MVESEHLDAADDDSRELLRELRSKARVKAVIIAAMMLLGGVVLYFSFFTGAINAPKIGRIPLAGFDQPGELELRVPGGHKLAFVLGADKYSYSGRNWILLDVRGLKDGVEVAKVVDCATKRVRGTGSALISSAHYDRCDMTVPAGGLTRLRARVRRKYPNRRLEAKGLVIEIAERK